MTEGNGFLLDRGSRPRRQKAIRRNSSTEDENQKKVALLVFLNGRYRIALGSARLGSARIAGGDASVQKTALLDNTGTRTVWAHGRVGHPT